MKVAAFAVVVKLPVVLTRSTVLVVAAPLRMARKLAKTNLDTA